MAKKGLGLAGFLLLVALVFAYGFARDVGSIVSGYVAQSLCTNVLILGRDQSDVEQLDLSRLQRERVSSVVEGSRVVSTANLGPVRYESTAVHRPGLGCSNFGEAPQHEIDLPSKAGDEALRFSIAVGTRVTDWPGLSAAPAGLDAHALSAAVAAAFTETTDDLYRRKNTRALLVSYKGHLVAERYAAGFNASTPLRGMSMTKSATSALVGALVGQGKLDIHAPAPIRGWPALSDGRSRVTTHHLLKMTAGFDYNEAYETDPRNLLNTMLMAEADMPLYAARTPLIGEPGESWDYQTTHSVLLQEVIRATLDDDQAYYRFPQQALFDRLGMRNSFFQADAAGTFIGGAFMFASGRDWLTLGQLYLNDGVHKGERILPEGWVEYSVTPSKPSLKKRGYGAQIWLNSAAPNQLFPGMPEDAYAFQGHYGQYVVVVPSLELVVVRLGMTFNGEEGFDKQAFLREVIAAVSS